MSKRTFEFSIEHTLDDRDVELDVTYSCTPFIRATFWQPAEGGEVEIEEVLLDGQPVILSPEDEQLIYEAARDRVADDWANEDASEADYRYDMKREAEMDA